MRNLPPEAKNGIIELLNKTVADQLQFLLEKKHLYQSITIDIKPILGLGASYTDRGRDDRAVSQLLDRARLSPSDQPSFVANTDGTQTPDFQLLLNHVKLFCKKCDSREAFVPIWFRDITNELLKPSIREVSLSSVPSNDFQLFVITYQCQRCTGKPDVFIIRREGWKLMLDGRSPMEEVELPPFIPKQEKRLFRDALIAIHGGKVLAALFYLRTFIEQFARRCTGLRQKLTGDELMSTYTSTLPLEHRSYMPSLGEWYNKLSEVLHEAREDANLFEEARVAIEQHFDIRRVFKIPETDPRRGVSDQKSAE